MPARVRIDTSASPRPGSRSRAAGRSSAAAGAAVLARGPRAHLPSRRCNPPLGADARRRLRSKRGRPPRSGPCHVRAQIGGAVARGRPSASARGPTGKIARMRRLTLLAAIAVTLVPAPAEAGRGLLVGVSEDGLKFEPAAAARDARRVGFRAFRITAQWSPGQRNPTVTQLAEL